jgi:coenzyme F420-reducing hydrogenase delta subunit
VLVTGCRAGGCAFRLGNRWTEDRLAGAREPHLRAGAPGKALRIAWADRGEETELAVVLDEMRKALADERSSRASALADPMVASTGMSAHG